MNSPIIVVVVRSSTNFAGTYSLPFNWLISNDSFLARVDYPKLCNIIGTLYEIWNEDEKHFRFPDLLGRVALGDDKIESRVTHAKSLCIVGGQATHVFTIAQLPSHEHDKDHLAIEHAGENTHAVTGRKETTSGKQQFSLLPRFQIFNYIIYASD